MIDTLELTYKLPSRKIRDTMYQAINNSAGNTRKLHPKNSRRSYHIQATSAFYPYGMLEVAIVDNNAHGYSSLKVKYKPAIIIHKGNKYALSSLDDYDRAVANFNDFIGFLNNYLPANKLPDIFSWEITRIDYAFSFSTERYSEYLTLLKKGYPKVKDDIYASSVYIPKKNTTINFYDKTVALGLSDNEHNLRFEVQCKRHYLLHLLEKHRCEGCNIFYLWDKKLALNIVLHKIKDLAGTGDFYDIRTATDRIRDQYGKKKTDKLVELLKVSTYPKARLGNIPKICSEHTGITEKSICSNLMPSLGKIGVNLYVLPDTWRLSLLRNPAGIIKAQA